ncbi:MAG: MaoC family dehydratase [Hyphomicrobiaceae bacterium]|jgi:3-hydroxybutyryl-CoA dehydratase
MLSSYYFEDLEPGMEARLVKTITEADVIGFATVTGDCNPIHLDPVYAAATPFKSRVAHGMLTGGLLSAVFGTTMPGPGAIYVSQTMNFRAPVMLGDTVTAVVRVVELFGPKRRVRFDCECRVGDKTVLSGEAMLIVPGRPA